MCQQVGEGVCIALPQSVVEPRRAGTDGGAHQIVTSETRTVAAVAGRDALDEHVTRAIQMRQPGTRFMKRREQGPGQVAVDDGSDRTGVSEGLRQRGDGPTGQRVTQRRVGMRESELVRIEMAGRPPLPAQSMNRPQEIVDCSTARGGRTSAHAS